MRKLMLLVLLHFYCFSFCQSVKEKLSAAVKMLEADTQCRHGIAGLYIIDSKTGAVFFNKNGELGLAPASCQKIVISVAAFELLGKDYCYKTTLGYRGKIDSGILSGDIILQGNGDPTLGSWRYEGTKENILIDEFVKAIKDAGISSFTGKIITENNKWETQTIPRGWIWEDIGNYYGAGASAINWRENQYDLILKSGRRFGDSVKIIATDPNHLQGVNLINELTSAEAGTGDNTIIYLSPQARLGYIRGTIPANENHFIVSGSMPDAALQLRATLYKKLNYNSSSYKKDSSGYFTDPAIKIFYTHTSPSLDSINYWFLKKSINLYGEALVKTIAYEKKNYGSTDTGINIIKDFWSAHGIEKTALNIIDGSGLSPANKVTPAALTTVLQYASEQKWFPLFYNALPEINGIKMKSGSIGGVASYTGFIKSKNGAEYTFAFILNNYNGSGNTVREKMWRVLDILK